MNTEVTIKKPDGREYQAFYAQDGAMLKITVYTLKGAAHDFVEPVMENPEKFTRKLLTELIESGRLD